MVDFIYRRIIIALAMQSVEIIVDRFVFSHDMLDDRIRRDI